MILAGIIGYTDKKMDFYSWGHGGHLNMVKEKQPKVYIDKYKQKYGSANVPDTKNKPIIKESKVVYDNKALDDFTSEPSKVDKPIDYSNANELKARFSARS